MTEDFDPVAASGESTYRAPRPLELNEILINGDADVEEIEPGKFTRKGGYLRKRILVGKTRDEKPLEEKLGDNINVIFLKIRRKLVERSQGGQVVRSTNEHTSTGEIVDLYDENGLVRSGSAKAIREAHPGLRTIQIVYALLVHDPAAEPELVRITIKGASLGSEAKDAKAVAFYKYISSYGKDEHFWEYVTNISTILEKGQKSYFCMNFARGARLDDKSLALALEKMKEVHLKCVEIDTARTQKRSVDSNNRPTHEEDIRADDEPSDPAPAREAFGSDPDAIDKAWDEHMGPMPATP